MKKAIQYFGSYLLIGLLGAISATFIDPNSPLNAVAQLAFYFALAVPAGTLIGLALILPHELAHIYVGSRLGYKLCYLQVIGFIWQETSGSYSLTWTPRSSLATRILYKKEPDITELRKILIAGPIASLAMAGLFAPLLFWNNTQIVGAFIMTLYGIYALGSLIGTENFECDGKLLRQSFKEPTDFLKQARQQYDLVVEWQRPKGYRMEAVELTGDPDKDCAYRMYWYWKLMDMGKVTEAEPHLREAFSFVARGSRCDLAAECCYESAVYFRRFKPDATIVEEADKLCQEIDPTNDKRQIVEAARKWVAGDKATAIGLWSAFSEKFISENSLEGTQLHGRDWFIRLCTEDMVFETDRLFARLWREEDLADMTAIYTNPEVHKYLGPQPTTPEEVEAKLQGRLNDQKDWPLGHGAWALVRKEGEKVIGAVFCDESPKGEKEIAWHLAQEFWGYGYATEAANGLKDYIFTQLPQVKKLRAVILPENYASRNVAKKIGMTSVGVSDEDYGVMLEVFEIVR